MKQLIKRIITLVTVLLLLFSITPASVTNAAFPGSSNRVTWTSFDFENEQLSQKSSKLDGSDPQTASYWDDIALAVRYSADGQKMTTAVGETTAEAYVANSDGTNKTNVSNIDREAHPDRSSYVASYPSFNHDGSQVVYGESWHLQDEDYHTTYYSQIIVVNSDGTNKNALTSANGNTYDVHPVFSPDGSKIAFLRNDFVNRTAGIYIMNADGSGQEELVRTATDVDKECDVDTLILGGSLFSEGEAYCTTFDWSPDGSKLVFTRVIEGEVVDKSQLVISDLFGNLTVVRERTSSAQVGDDDLNPEDSPVSLDMRGMLNAQFTPDGRIIYRELSMQAQRIYEEEDSSWHDLSESFAATSAIKLINTNGSNDQTVVEESGEGESQAEVLIFSHVFPTIQPGVSNESENSNIRLLTNAIDSKTVIIQTPVDTTLTCSNAIQESANTVQDGAYKYPLGLVEFCFDTNNISNQVSLSFVTNLKSDQVKARKYHALDNTYFDIKDAVITETTYNGQHALTLTYTILDNGELDLDPVTGKIKDPVGLTLVEQELAATGQRVWMPALIAVVLIITPGFYLLRRRYTTPR